MSGPGDSGDLFDDDMGDDVTGGNVRFGDHGAHHSVYGDGRHFSWDDEYRDEDYDPYSPNDSAHGMDDISHTPY